jgi:hypothetical protein
MVITEIMRTTPGLLPAQELADRMLSALPSFARNPQQATRQHIRQANGRQLVFLDADNVLSLRNIPFDFVYSLHLNILQC